MRRRIKATRANIERGQKVASAIRKDESCRGSLARKARKSQADQDVGLDYWQKSQIGF
jgi:hypothetical protein